MKFKKLFFKLFSLFYFHFLKDKMNRGWGGGDKNKRNMGKLGKHEIDGGAAGRHSLSVAAICP